MDVWYSRVDDVAVIAPSLSELRTKLRLENVKSCLALGCGQGMVELYRTWSTARRTLANLQPLSLILRVLRCLLR